MRSITFCEDARALFTLAEQMADVLLKSGRSSAGTTGPKRSCAPVLRARGTRVPSTPRCAGTKKNRQSPADSLSRRTIAGSALSSGFMSMSFARSPSFAS